MTPIMLPHSHVLRILQTIPHPEASVRTLYRVYCPEHSDGILLVISDSPEGAASFLQLALLDQYQDRLTQLVESGPKVDFSGTYEVCPMAEQVGHGIWLSGYDGSDDLEALLRPTVPDYDTVNRFPLWGPMVEVNLTSEGVK